MQTIAVTSNIILVVALTGKLNKSEDLRGIVYSVAGPSPAPAVAFTWFSRHIESLIKHH